MLPHRFPPLETQAGVCVDKDGLRARVGARAHNSLPCKKGWRTVLAPSDAKRYNLLVLTDTVSNRQHVLTLLSDYSLRPNNSPPPRD